MTVDSGSAAHSEGVALPTGTVTFLFSDIEGSTQHWEAHRHAMDGAVKRHDAHLRAAMRAHGGHVFKTFGDAFCVAFARVTDAVAAGVEVQRALYGEDFSAVGGLRVRSALHTGEAVERNGDYFGPAVNRVSRLMSVGHGGQVLVSGVTHDLTGRDLPAGTSLVDLGLHRLKDLAEPEQIWQLSVDGLPNDFPPLRSLDALPNNLPIARTSFVGRERDVAALTNLIAHNRLVTLVGSGGIGKTRLALQVGAELLDRFSDGVWFVDCAPVADPELVPSVTAHVLGMTQREGQKIDASIPIWLKRKKLLLILDNCEHVLETLAPLVAATLGAAPEVRVLATSRQALGIAGEKVSRLESLAVPQNLHELTPETALEFGAVALFADRASLVDGTFALTRDTAPIVADICRRLDGIPLAIELAAARVRVLAIPDLARRLNERFKILTGGGRDALPRQKTLGALIDWSYDLLTAQEQLLFDRLGIFAGGFGLDAAVHVCGGDGVDDIALLDVLASLTDKSLLVADTSGERARYRLLETTGAYALQKLVASGEREPLALRHAGYFRDLALAADERYGEGSTFAWLAEVELELDNYRAALDWGLNKGNDVVLAGTIAGALDGMWQHGGLPIEGRYWCELALQCVDETAHPRIAARLLQALSGHSSGKTSYAAAERAMRLYRTAGDLRGAARAQRRAGFALLQMGQVREAQEAIEHAIASMRSCDDRWGTAGCLHVQATIEFYLGHTEPARALFDRARDVFKQLDNELGMASVLSNLAELEFAAGRPQEALDLSQEALDICARRKNVDDIAGLLNVAAYKIALEDFDGARQSAKEGLRSARQSRHAPYAAIALQHLALLAATGGATRRAARSTGYVDAQYQALGMRREPTEQWGYDKLLSLLGEHLAADEIAGLRAQGAAWSEDRAVEEGLAAL